MFKMIKNIKEKIQDKKPINIFGSSVFDYMDDRTSAKDRFIDMVNIYKENRIGITHDQRFIRSINLLDRLRETYFFSDHLTNSPFGVMLDIDYIDVTDDHGMYVHCAVKEVLHQLSDMISSDFYNHEVEKNVWIAFGYELTHTDKFHHSVLVIPYTDKSGYTKICRMIIPAKEKL